SLFATYAQSSGLTKEDQDPLTNMEAPKEKESIHTAWLKLIDSCATSEEFLEKFSTTYTKDYIRYRRKLEYFAKKFYAKGPEPYVPPLNQNAFDIPLALQQWVQKNLIDKPHRPKSLVLIGRTGLGKTQWARSLGQHTYHSGHLNTNADILHSVQYAIFDNFSLDKFLRYKNWLGAQVEFSHRPRYGKDQTIKWGRPVIWCCNDDADPRLAKNADVQWSSVNCVFVNIDKPLFVQNSTDYQPFYSDWGLSEIEEFLLQ
ncbi:hypothetical protein DFQ30_004712, partial [Apophysomyces sp. BC1015]